MPGVEPPQRRIGKIPFARVKAESLINHLGLVVCLASGAKENRLAAVRVAGPLVKCQHAAKIGEVPDFTQLLLGQKIIRRASPLVSQGTSTQTAALLCSARARAQAASPNLPYIR